MQLVLEFLIVDKNGNDFYKNKYRPQIIPEEVFCKNLAKTSIHIDPNKKLHTGYKNMIISIQQDNNIKFHIIYAICAYPSHLSANL